MKLNSKTVGKLMLMASIEHPEDEILHRSLQIAFKILEKRETELLRAIEARVEQQDAVNHYHAAKRQEEIQKQYETPVDLNSAEFARIEDVDDL